MCDKCKIMNEDSKRGYIVGCSCHKPDVEGLYRCMVKVKESTGVVITTYNSVEFDKTNNKWLIEDNKNVLRWELMS